MRRQAACHITMLLCVVMVVHTGCGPPSTLPAPAGVRARVDTIYYDVEGSDPRSWLTSMSRAASSAGVPRPYLAHTTWTTRWSYAATRNASGGCSAVRPSVDAQIRFTMPRLRTDSAATPAALAEWRRFMASLWSHEQGHAQRGMRAAAGELDALRDLRTTTCHEFGVEAGLAANLIVQKYQASNAEYDAQTRHGARQGANLIVDPSRRMALDTTYRDTVR